MILLRNHGDISDDDDNDDDNENNNDNSIQKQP